MREGKEEVSLSFETNRERDASERRTNMGTHPRWVQTPTMTSLVEESEYTMKVSLRRYGERVAKKGSKRAASEGREDSPLRLLSPLSIGLGIPEVLDVDLVGLVDLGLSPVPDEDGLSSPLEDDVLSLWDGSHRDLNLRQSQNIGGSREGSDKIDDRRLGSGGGEGTEGSDHEVGEVSVGRDGGRSVFAEIGSRDGVSRKGRGGGKGSSRGEEGGGWRDEKNMLESVQSMGMRLGRVRRSEGLLLKGDVGIGKEDEEGRREGGRKGARPVRSFLSSCRKDGPL